MRSHTNLVFVTLSVLIIYSNCQCLCSRRGRVRAEDNDLKGDGQRPSECNRDCPKVYSPVCATDGFTYRNYCHLKKKMCKGAPVLLDHLGKCAKVVCNEACISLPDPVCGTDGKTYDNECHLNQAMVCKGVDVVQAHKGQCTANESRGDCISPCPYIYSPVCGTNGKTYPNMCVLENAICKKEKVAFAHEGQCREPPFGSEAVDREVD